MPRKPARHGHMLRHQPLTFSPFARLVAQVASFSSVNRQMPDSDSAGNEFDKRSLKESEQCESSSKEEFEECESSDEEDFEGVVQADFAFFDPKPSDFHGVKTLLQTFLDDEQWDLSGFVDLILGQPTVGTVVKLEEDEDDALFSIVSVLNLERYKDHKCITEVKEYLLKVGQKDVIGELRLLLEKQGQNVGLLVSQRVVNLPPQLFPPLYDALFDEVSWATEDEPTEELRKSFHFNYYLVVSKIYKHKNAGMGKRISEEEAIIYIKPEDEILYKLSSWSFDFALRTEQHVAYELRNYQLMGLVMAVKADKISTFRQELHSLIDES